ISVGVVAVVGAAAFFATRSRKPARPEEATGEDAVKAGDALFKQHKYLAAIEMYEKAGNSPAPNRKKTVEEAQGEEAYNSLRAAIAADDGDKARTLFDRCAADSTYWCRQAQEQGDQVRSAYAKKHLAQAPKEKNTLMLSYRSLGYGYAYLNDKDNAVKWLEKYLPYCSNDCDQVQTFIGK